MYSRNSANEFVIIKKLGKVIPRHYLLFSWMKVTTKTVRLPNISFVSRKPEPLGTEFKVATDRISGAIRCS